MKKIKILCILLTLLGIAVFVFGYFYIPTTSPYLPWILGMGAALIVLGIGYYMNTLFFFTNRRDSPTHTLQNDTPNTNGKERAGYLVCKIMGLLLCIYLLILNRMQADFMILILGAALLLLQYLLDLILQFYFAVRNEK